MSDSSFESLEAVIQDESFPDTDLALRRGRHIGRDDPSYDFLVDAASHLEPLYRRFGCELVQRSDGYFYLLPSRDRLGRRHLSTAEVLVGETLALCYLDPATLEQSGAVPREVLLQRLVGLIGQESLVRTLNPRRKRLLERVSEETVRKQVGEAVRRLADLGFVDMLEESHLGYTTEVPIDWSGVTELFESVMRRARDEFPRAADLTMLGAHSSHSYQTGTNLYFVYDYNIDCDPREEITEYHVPLNAIVVEEALRLGGSMVHHHGIGKLRKAKQGG